MHVPEITEVKSHFEKFQKEGLVDAWELPYENLLTRRSAAIFFVTPAAENTLESVLQDLRKIQHFSYRENTEKKISKLQYRITFSEEEKEKNKKLQTS
jgi:hypothetical protein